MGAEVHQVSSSHNVIQSVKDTTEQYSLVILLFIFLFSCLSTRAITGLQSQTQASSTENEPRRARKLPYWVPGVGHAFSYLWSHRDFLLGAQKTMNEPVVALQMGFQTQYFVYSPDMIRTILSSGEARSGVHPKRVMENFVGAVGSFRRLTPQALKAINNSLKPLTQETYLVEISSVLAKALERETANFISFNRSLVDQTVWERNVTIILEDNSDDSSNPQSCQAELFALVRSFTSYIITYVFMGQAILEFHSEVLDDLWKWDREYVSLVAGAPRWIPLPGISGAYAARNRVQKTISVLQASMSALEDGRNTPLEFQDLDDVSELMQDRVRLWRTLGLSSVLSAQLDSWLLWKLTADASKLIFWNILRIYSDPELLSDVRKEIAPFARIPSANPKETGLPIAETPRIWIDAEKLFTSCLLLKATFAETIRLDSNPIAYREVVSDITLTESEKDAALFSTNNDVDDDGEDDDDGDDEKQPRSYKFLGGDILGLASGASHIDPAYYPNPESFDPDRFLSTSASASTSNNNKNKNTNKSNTKETPSFNWQTVLPFGGDDIFSQLIERQVLLITASIVSLWDIEPVDQQGFKVPGHILSANAYKPSFDLKARLKRHV